MEKSMFIRNSHKAAQVFSALEECHDLERCRFPVFPTLIGTLAALNIASVLVSLVV
jgi:hypothetical protein